jgi:hypothetical protein
MMMQKTVHVSIRRVCRGAVIVVALVVGATLGVGAGGYLPAGAAPPTLEGELPAVAQDSSAASAQLETKSAPVLDAEVAALEQVLLELEAPTDLPGDPVVEGTVTVPGTDEPQLGALVTLEAWPRPSELANLRPGDRVPTVTVAKAMTDDQGDFALKLTDTEVLEQFADDAGDVDLEVVVLTPHGPEVAGGTVALDDLDSAIDPDFTAPPAIEGVLIEAEDPVTPSELLLDQESAELSKAMECGWYYDRGLGARDTRVAVLGSQTPLVRVSMTYQKGQASYVGWGVSSKTNATGYSQSATSKVSATIDAGYDDYTGPFRATYWRKTDYARYRYGCVGDTTQWKIRYENKWQVKPTGGIHSSWSTKESITPPASSKCEIYEKSVSISGQTGLEIAGGVSIASVIGINFTSKTDFTSGTKATFTRTTGAGKFRICGSANFPSKPAAGTIIAVP